MTRVGTGLAAAALLCAGQAGAEPETAKIKVYGEVNLGVLNYDDGVETESYGPLDNNNEPSRIGVEVTRRAGAWTFRNRNEFGYPNYSSATVSILERSPPSGSLAWSNANIRRIEFSAAHARYGTLTLGQGSMATDGAPEADLSGTAVVSYSEIEDSAAGQLFRLKGSDLPFPQNVSAVSVGDAFDNYNGPRLVRLRYDTPVWRGASVAAAWGRNLLTGAGADRDDDVYDVALTYAGAVGATHLAAGAGYRRDADLGDVTLVSASALHAPSGANLTLAAGRGGGGFWYAKLGVTRAHLVGWGATAASVDWYEGRDIAGPGSDSASWSLAAVQTIDRANLDLWLTWRVYRYDDPAADYADGRALFGGARWRF